MDVAHLGIRIDSDGVPRATGYLRDFEGQAGRAERQTSLLTQAFRILAPAIGALGAAFSVRALTQYADAWSDMQSRIGAAIKDMEAAPAMMQRMVDIANASYSPLEQTVEIYGRNVSVLRDLGRGATEAADFTEALNHALVTTATKGQDADVVLNAISRSIATGRLRTMEFETIMSRSPRVLEAVADQMGTTVTGLRALAAEGKVTGDVIVDALINNLELLREEAGEMPATIGDAFTRVRTNTTALIGTLDQAWGVSGRVAESILEMADRIRESADFFLRLGNIVGSVVSPAFDFLGGQTENLAGVAGIALAALSGFFAPVVLSGLAAVSMAIGTTMVAAVRALTAAMLANPLGLFIAGIAAAVTAAFTFRDEIKQTIGVDVVGVFESGANTIIGAMVGAYRAIQMSWDLLPAYFGDIGARAWNAFLTAFEGPAVTWTIPGTDTTIDLINLDLSGFKRPTSNVSASVENVARQAFASAQGHNYVGSIATALGEAWTNAEGATASLDELMAALDANTASAGALDNAVGGVGKSLTAANDNVGDMTDALRQMDQVGQQVTSKLASAFTDLFESAITGAGNFWDIVKGLFADLGRMFATQGFQMLLGVGGGPLSWIGSLFGFAGGGYTGAGGVNEPAGIVHRGEYVFSAAATNRIGVGYLDALHSSARGYRDGGYVTPAPRSANSNYANQNGGYLEVRVITEVQNGNLVPVMAEVAGEVAGQRIAQTVPVAMGRTLKQANKNAPSAVAQHRAQRGGDWRLG